MDALTLQKYIKLIFSFIIFETVSFRKDSERGCFLKNIIPYKFYGIFSDMEKLEIMNAIGILQNKTCVFWVAMDDFRSVTSDHVRFRRSPDDDCLTIFDNVYLTTRCIMDGEVVLHELMHVLGFRHEHQRGDRNCYIKVDSAVEDDNQYKIKPSESWLERFPYDKFSITHYKRSDRLKNIEEPVDIPWPLGQERFELTYLDVWKIQYKYCGAPHYCDLYKENCRLIEDMEKSRECRKS